MPTNAEIVESLRAALPDVVVATDFDGTLAPLVSDPEQSRPVDGALGALSALAGRGARVAVISGRDARTVLRLGGFDAVPRLTVAGLYGAETWQDGQLRTLDPPPELDQLRARLPHVLARAGGDPALWIEDKRLSLVVHARRAADPQEALDAVRQPVRRLADELGLDVHPGSAVLEIRLPGYDKAGALHRLAGDARGVLFLGDDVGDLPAFGEIRELRNAGRVAWSVAVLSSEVADIRGAADLDLPDPAAAVGLLAELAD